ncbi:MAG: hypothetical protein JXA93_22405 [Anaerolineae bacterium]|nr:hypothetical protein [Anaerolineae bacterium]
MLRKLVGGRTPAPAARDIPPADLERALARLCLEPVGAAWAALVTADGMVRGCFPSQGSIGRDRISAMSAAMSSLGERISRELSTGALGYTLIAGVEGATLMIALDDRHLLSLGLPRAHSLDAVFEGVRLSAVPLLRLLGIAAIPV